jgi:hypothetical protein
MINGFDDWKDKISPEDSRFKYRPFKKKLTIKRYLLYFVPIVIILTLLITLWWIPSWYANINLQAQLYSNKAGGLDFNNFYFLNLWSTKFFFNKTALIGAFIGVIIMSVPPERILLTLIGTKLRFGKPSLLKSLVFWWTIGFLIFYLFGFLLDANDGLFSWTIYLIENNEIQVSSTIILDAFNVLFDPSSKNFEVIFVYNNLVLPIIYFVLAIIIFRIILNIIKNFYLRKNEFYVFSNVLVVIGLIFGLWFFTLPTQALDGINLIQTWSVVFGFISFILIGLGIFLIGRLVYSRDSTNYTISQKNRKKFGIGVLVVLLLILFPVFISIGPAININNTSVWTEQKWDKKFRREIEWTRECAGLDMFEERPIENLTQSTVSSDGEILSHIRQYDQRFAVQYLAASIASTFEGLADSDIVYLNNKEYWVAPKSVKFSEITLDKVKTSTEFYDHVEGFLAIDTLTGQLVNVTSTFNITQNYPIFFGESESERFLTLSLGYIPEGILGAYDSDILLGTEWAGGIESNEYNYTGQPDGTLSGLEDFWKKINLGLIAYVNRPENEYLVNRNIKSRVSNILLPQLTIDKDPYLVFNQEKGEMYYAVSIFTNIRIGSYARYPILRFLGVCLVNVLNGELTFYKNPALDADADPTYPLWKIYTEKYNWQPIDNDTDWLKAQLRYPEDLFELQLEANYIYHVQDPLTWKSETDFHERPTDGDLFYIESDLGEGIEYIGLDLVEYKGRTATLLAGTYVVRHGDHFGEAIFYHTRGPTQSLIGPQSASQTYLTEATQEITLISGARNGNILLYPLADSLYFYIPTYSTAGSLQQLKLAGFVEAFTRKVGYGDNAQEAYSALNITGTEIPSNLSISYNFEVESSMKYPDDPANFEITLQNIDTNYSAPGLDVSVNLTLYSSTTNDLNYSLILPPDLYPIENYTYSSGAYTYSNFTLINDTLYFGEGLILNGFVNTDKGNVVIIAKWTLIVDEIIVYESPETIIVVLG